MIQKIIRWIFEFIARVNYVFSGIAFDQYKIRSDCDIKWLDLMKDLNRQFVNATYIYVTDSQPKLIYKADMQKLLDLNLSIKRYYKKEIFDCENFAYFFRGIMSWFYGNHAFGTVRVNTGTTEHMLNCFIDEFGKFWYLEPQTNEIFKPKDRPKWTVRHIII